MISLVLYALLIEDCLLALIHRQVHVLLAFLRALGLSDLMTLETKSFNIDCIHVPIEHDLQMFYCRKNNSITHRKCSTLCLKFVLNLSDSLTLVLFFSSDRNASKHLEASSHRL